MGPRARFAAVFKSKLLVIVKNYFTLSQDIWYESPTPYRSVFP